MGGIGFHYRPTPLGCVIGLVGLGSLGYGAVALYGVVRILADQPERIWAAVQWGVIGVVALLAGGFLVRLGWRRSLGSDDSSF